MKFPLCTPKSYYFEREIQIDSQLTRYIL